MRIVLLIFIFIVGEFKFIESFTEKREIVVRIVGGPFEAQLLAQQNGFIFNGNVSKEFN